jgi:hypothetical protein
MSTALELRAAHGEVAGPADQLHHGVLVDGLALAADGNEVAIAVRTERDVVRVQHPHVVGSRLSRYRRPSPRPPKRRRRRTSATGSPRRHLGVRDLLNGLQRVDVQREEVRVRDEQVRLVVAANHSFSDAAVMYCMMLAADTAAPPSVTPEYLPERQKVHTERSMPP